MIDMVRFRNDGSLNISRNIYSKFMCANPFGKKNPCVS